MRATPRRRRRIRPSRARWIRPLFRYSYTRDAFVLRVVGRHVGPVFQVADRARPAAARPRAATREHADTRPGPASGDDSNVGSDEDQATAPAPAPAPMPDFTGRFAPAPQPRAGSRSPDASWRGVSSCTHRSAARISFTRHAVGQTWHNDYPGDPPAE
jgi:hypothetical protein